jgi:hypothetical protein
VAIKGDSWMLKYVPNNLITKELCLIAVQKLPPCDLDDILYLVPKKFKKQVKENIKNATDTYIDSRGYTISLLNNFFILASPDGRENHGTYKISGTKIIASYDEGEISEWILKEDFLTSSTGKVYKKQKKSSHSDRATQGTKNKE